MTAEPSAGPTTSEPTSDAGAEAAQPADDTPAGYPWTPSALVAVRGHATRRRLALGVAAVVGLGLAWLHWLGLVAAGILLGLPSRTVRWAVLAGLGFGVIVLAVNVLAIPAMGPGEFFGLLPVSVLTIVAAIVAPVWGALVRAVV